MQAVQKVCRQGRIRGLRNSSLQTRQVRSSAGPLWSPSDDVVGDSWRDGGMTQADAATELVFLKSWRSSVFLESWRSSASSALSSTSSRLVPKLILFGLVLPVLGLLTDSPQRGSRFDSVWTSHVLALFSASSPFTVSSASLKEIS